MMMDLLSSGGNGGVIECQHDQRKACPAGCGPTFVGRWASSLSQFFVVRVSQALDWISTMLEGPIKTSDGQALFVQRCALLTFSCCFAESLRSGLLKGSTDHDVNLLKAELGDPVWSAQWELLGLLRAIDAWLVFLRWQSLALFQMNATAAQYATYTHSTGLGAHFEKLSMPGVVSVDEALRGR